MQQTKIPVAVKTTSLDQSQEMKLTATIEMENDLETNNNTTSVSVRLITAKLASPTDLKATAAGENKVKLRGSSIY